MEELIQKFNELPQKMEVKILRQTVTDMGQKMVSELKTRVPVAATHKVRRSWKLAGGGSNFIDIPLDLKDSIFLSKSRKKKDSLIADIRANFYAKFLEFGSYGNAAYHPFVRPAMDTSGDQILKSALEMIVGELHKL